MSPAERPTWMEHEPKHARVEEFPTAPDPAARLSTVLIETRRMFAAAHFVLLGGVAR